MQAIKREQPEFPLEHVSHAEEAVRLQLDKDDDILTHFEFRRTKGPPGNVSKSPARLSQIDDGLGGHLVEQVALDPDGDEAADVPIFVRGALNKLNATDDDCVSGGNQFIAGQEDKTAGKYARHKENYQQRHGKRISDLKDEKSSHTASLRLPACDICNVRKLQDFLGINRASPRECAGTRLWPRAQALGLPGLFTNFWSQECGSGAVPEGPFDNSPALLVLGFRISHKMSE